MPKKTTIEKRQEWEQKIEQQKVSGLSIEKWCEQNHIPYHTFNYWREALGHVKPLKRPSFQELTDASSDAGVVIEKSKLRIHVSKNFDPRTLCQCLKALDNLC